MAQVSDWIRAARPALLVCDVSVEVSLLARLHGIPVVSVAMPGDRSDPPHRLGYDVSTVLIGCWPNDAGDVFRSAPEAVAKLRSVGGLSRFPVAPTGPRRAGPPRVSVLLGTGGSDITASMIDDARSQSPEWEWTVMGRHLDRWSATPFDAVRDADVVVTQAGQNAIAEVAAARRPAVVIPADRPHDEQRATARALAEGDWPAVVRPTWPHTGWAELLQHAAGLDHTRWAAWCDGQAALRFAAIVDELAERYLTDAS